MVEEQTLERPTGTDVGAALLDEYMELKGELGPLEKRMREVRDRLRDLVTEHGHFVDEARGVAVHVEARFRREYDAERLVAVFPRLAGCVKSSVHEPAGGLRDGRDGHRHGAGAVGGAHATPSLPGPYRQASGAAAGRR